MNADLILDAFEKIDDKYIIEAKEHRLMDANISTINSTAKKSRRLRHTFILVAAIFASLALCGFAAYEYACLTHGCKNRLLIQSKPYKVQLKGKLRKNTL